MSDDKVDLRFKDDRGGFFDPHEIIFPIVIEFDHAFQAVGTGTIIADNGLFISAKHVFQEVTTTRGAMVGIVKVHDEWLKFSIQTIAVHDDFDVGVGLLIGWKSRKNPQKLIRLAFSSRNPNPEEYVFSICHPRTATEESDGMKWVTAEASFSEGVYMQQLQRSPLYSWPVHQLLLQMAPGSSGAAIFNRNLEIIGICTTSIEANGVELPIAFAATTHTIIETIIPAFELSNGNIIEGHSMRDLGKLGLFTIR